MRLRNGDEARAAARKVAAAISEVSNAKSAYGEGSKQHRRAEKDRDRAFQDASMAGTLDSEIFKAMGR